MPNKRKHCIVLYLAVYCIELEYIQLDILMHIAMHVVLHNVFYSV